MDKAGSMMWETRIAYKILFGNPKGRENLDDIGIGLSARIILDIS
jgi:hypothetical protein